MVQRTLEKYIWVSDFRRFSWNFLFLLFCERTIKICPYDDDNEVLITRECIIVIIIHNCSWFKGKLFNPYFASEYKTKNVYQNDDNVHDFVQQKSLFSNYRIHTHTNYGCILHAFQCIFEVITLVGSNQWRYRRPSLNAVFLYANSRICNWKMAFFLEPIL